MVRFVAASCIVFMHFCVVHMNRFGQQREISLDSKVLRSLPLLIRSKGFLKGSHAHFSSIMHVVLTYTFIRNKIIVAMHKKGVQFGKAKKNTLSSSFVLLISFSVLRTSC